jgi:transposase-like protein
MSWKETTYMSLRSEFIHMAEDKEANFSELCRRFGISRKTGYKWQKRFREQGERGFGGPTPPPASQSTAQLGQG